MPASAGAPASTAAATASNWADTASSNTAETSSIGEFPVELGAVEVAGPQVRGLSTVRDTSPDTVEFRQADAIRKSSRVPKVRTLWPGIGQHGQVVGERRAAAGRDLRASAAVSSLAIAPLPVQPSTNTTDAGS